MTKNYVCFTLYLRNRTSYDCGFWYTFVKWWYLQNITKITNVILSRSISQELYIISSRFLVRRCKIISPGVFLSFFSFFLFKKKQHCKCWNYFGFLLVHFNSFFIFLIFVFQVHQWMPKRNSNVYPTFFTCVWFFTKR